jgi:hypothetical protein
MEEAKFLRHQAQRCRRLAQAITDEQAVAALEKMAAEFDARAAALDAKQPPEDPA